MISHEPTTPKSGKAAIDWQTVHQRLDAASAGIERMWAPGAEETRQILKARARLLARESAKADVAGEHLEVVEFRLAYEHYAIESRFVREVYPLDNLTPLPCTPAFVVGIVSVRGEIISVIDLKTFFELPDQGITDLHKVIVIESGDMLFGVLADAILGVRRISTGDIQASLPTLTGIRESYLKGVTVERMVVLDAEKLLTGKNILVDEAVEA